MTCRVMDILISSTILYYYYKLKVTYNTLQLYLYRQETFTKTTCVNKEMHSWASLSNKFKA